MLMAVNRVGVPSRLLVGVNPATNAVVAMKGSDSDYFTELTVDLIAGVNFGRYIPCEAVRIQELIRTCWTPSVRGCALLIWRRYPGPWRPRWAERR